MKEDFAAERSFMSPRLSEIVSPDDWKKVRLETIQIAGKIQRYTVHAVTFYQDDFLLVAADFSGPSAYPDTLVCGFMVWELPEANEIGLVRFEQNVVALKVFRKMPVDKAAQKMADWRCPAALIESALGVSMD